MDVRHVYRFPGDSCMVVVEAATREQELLSQGVEQHKNRIPLDKWGALKDENDIGSFLLVQMAEKILESLERDPDMPINPEDELWTVSATISILWQRLTEARRKGLPLEDL